MTFYSELASTALSLIERFGQVVSFSRPTGETFDPVTGTTSPGTPETFTGQGILKDYGTQHIDGQMIQQGDKELIVAAKDLNAPALTDTVTVNGDEYQIVNIEANSPAGTALVYKLQVRP